MSSLPPELVDPVERLRATLIGINDSEQTCMTTVVTTASHATRVPEVQAIIARCRQTAAAVAATAVDTFRAECTEIRARYLVDDRGDHCGDRLQRRGLLDQIGELRGCLRL
jgi:hypothetical protein